MRTTILLIAAGLMTAIATQFCQAQPPPPPDRLIIAGAEPADPFVPAPPPGDVLVLVSEPMSEERVPATRPGDDGQAWLGIEVDVVPPPLAAHLELAGTGVMVRNVFRGSPADKAGLQRYDVIVEADGEKVSPDVLGFTRYVKHRKPGDTLRLVYYRQGKRTEVSIQITQRPGRWEELERKFPDEPAPGPYDFRGRIMRRGPEGWIMDDLGPLPEPRELPRRLWLYADRLFDKPGPPPGIERPEGRSVDKEGRVLVVRRNPDGTVVVKRYRPKEGEKTAEIKNYPNEKELETADREAFDLLKAAEADCFNVPASEMAERMKEGVQRFHDRMKAYEEALKDLDNRTEDYQKNIRQWRERLDRGLRDNRWGDRWEQWRDRFFQGPFEEMRPPLPPPPATQPGTCAPSPDRRLPADLLQRLGPGHPSCRPPMPPPPQGTPGIGPKPDHAPGLPQAPPPPPKVRFEVQPDGSIHVYVRDRDTEMCRPYPSEQALKEQAPELHKQYQAMQEQFR